MEPIRWSCLPDDILTTISVLLNTEIDVLRVRAVCSSWRSAVPLPRRSFSFPLSVPSPPSPYPPSSFLDIFPDDFSPASDPFSVLLPPSPPLQIYPNSLGPVNVVQATIYLVSPLDDRTSASISPRGWLIKAVEVNPKTFSLLNPLTSELITKFPQSFPGQINLLDYRVSEVGKAYCLRSTNRWTAVKQLGQKYGRKAVVLSHYVDGHDLVVLLLLRCGKLMFWRWGDEYWNSMEDEFGDAYKFDDVILCKGTCYAIDGAGVLVMIDSALKPIRIASTAHFPGHLKHLVECKGDIYSVTTIYRPGHERWLDDFEDEFVRDECSTVNMPPLLVKIFKFNEHNRGWCLVNNLEKKAFILGDDVTFSIHDDMIEGCKWNCIYLRDETFWKEDEGTASVFNLCDGTATGLGLLPEYVEIFWPPPNWIMPSVGDSSQLRAVHRFADCSLLNLCGL